MNKLYEMIKIINPFAACGDYNNRGWGSRKEYNNLNDYFAEWEYSELDKNFIYRFDVEPEKDDEGMYVANTVKSIKLYVIHQRKGALREIEIFNVKDACDDDVNKFINLMRLHKEYSKNMYAQLDMINK